MRRRAASAAAMLTLAVAVSSCGGHISELVGTPNPAARAAGVRVPAAARYVRRIAAAAADLQHAVQAATSGLQSVAVNADGADPGADAQLAALVQQQRANILTAQSTLRMRTARHGPVAGWETETLLAVQDLAAAMQALATYLTNPAASSTPDSTSFVTASGEWNDAVTHLWSAAGITNPPTVPPAEGPA